MPRRRIEENHVIAAERRILIHRLVKDRGSVNASDLARTLGVGISTVRRDLDALHGEGKLVRVHGGAVVRETAVPRAPYKQSRTEHIAEKAAIAQAALPYVPQTGTIFIGGGTTTYQLAIRIPAGLEVTVATNALDVAGYLASHSIAQVDVVGGTVRPDSLQTNCEEALESLYWDVTFYSPAAMDISRGITTDNRAAARQEMTILGHGSRFVVLCDSSKIGKFAYARVAPVNVIDIFVTDSGADADFLRQLRETGIEVVVAETRPPSGS